MALAGASLIGADLAGLNLSGSDLSGADLSKAIAGHHPSEEASGLSCPIAVRLAACLGEEEGRGVDELVSLARAECGLAEDRVLEVLEGATERAEELSLLFG